MQTETIKTTATGSLDILGHEFNGEYQKFRHKSPLASDIDGSDVSSWRGGPRPAVTAWFGADMDAYYFDGVWIHCQTGMEWMK